MMSLPRRPKACSPMSGYVRIHDASAMHRPSSFPVYRNSSPAGRWKRSSWLLRYIEYLALAASCRCGVVWGYIVCCSLHLVPCLGFTLPLWCGHALCLQMLPQTSTGLLRGRFTDPTAGVLAQPVEGQWRLPRSKSRSRLAQPIWAAA